MNAIGPIIGAYWVRPGSVGAHCAASGIKTTHRHMGPQVGEWVSECQHASIIERAPYDVYWQLHFFVRVLLGALKIEWETLREKY